MSNKITKQDLNKVFWRMQVLNVTNNFQSNAGDWIFK